MYRFIPDSLCSLSIEMRSLSNYFLEVLSDNYLMARKRAIKKTNLADWIFPKLCPFSPEQILDPDYLPMDTE